MNIFTIIHRNEASIKIYDGEFDIEINYSFAEFCMSYRIMFRTIISSVFKKSSFAFGSTSKKIFKTFLLFSRPVCYPVSQTVWNPLDYTQNEKAIAPHYKLEGPGHSTKQLCLTNGLLLAFLYFDKK